MASSAVHCSDTQYCILTGWYIGLGQSYWGMLLSNLLPLHFPLSAPEHWYLGGSLGHLNEKRYRQLELPLHLPWNAPIHKKSPGDLIKSIPILQALIYRQMLYYKWYVESVTVWNVMRLSQLLKGAVGTTLCQNETELKFSMEISTRIHPHNKQGKSDWLNLHITDIYFL